jgi:hypothetical protein
MTDKELVLLVNKIFPGSKTIEIYNPPIVKIKRKYSKSNNKIDKKQIEIDLF